MVEKSLRKFWVFLWQLSNLQGHIIVRNLSFSIQLKKKHNYSCQVSEVFAGVRNNVFYAVVVWYKKNGQSFISVPATFSSRFKTVENLTFKALRYHFAAKTENPCLSGSALQTVYLDGTMVNINC